MFNSWNKIKIRKQIKSTTDEMDKMILRVLLNDKINPFDSETYPRTDEANKSIAKTDEKAEGLATKFINGAKTAAKWGTGIATAANTAAVNS